MSSPRVSETVFQSRTPRALFTDEVKAKRPQKRRRVEDAECASCGSPTTSPAKRKNCEMPLCGVGGHHCNNVPIDCSPKEKYGLRVTFTGERHLKWQRITNTHNQNKVRLVDSITGRTFHVN